MVPVRLKPWDSVTENVPVLSPPASRVASNEKVRVWPPKPRSCVPDPWTTPSSDSPVMIDTWPDERFVWKGPVEPQSGGAMFVGPSNEAVSLVPFGPLSVRYRVNHVTVGPPPPPRRHR